MTNENDQRHGSNASMKHYFFRASASDFKKIPGSPIAYWVSPSTREAFARYESLSKFSDTRIGLITGDNEYYIRQWHEVSHNVIGFEYSREDAKRSIRKWFPQSKGGDFRRWYGNNNTVLNWLDDGYELQNKMHGSGERVLAHNFNLDKIFLSGITWTKISSGTFGARLQPAGFLFNDASANAFPLDPAFQYPLLAFLCSKLPVEILKAMNPTLNFLPGNIADLPIAPSLMSSDPLKKISMYLVAASKEDWDSFEISWNFLYSPLCVRNSRESSVEAAYERQHLSWRQKTQEAQRLEQENNRIFIEAYGLQDELTPDVPLKEITLTCNPHYRYGGDKTDEELEALLLADTMREFLSYAVGCMFGRYSLDKPGLVLANQGETLADYLRQVPEPRFMPDEDNVIPLLDGEWFADDVTERFRQFLRVTFGETHYAENLAFIEAALGRDVRKYFLKDFYADHVKRYKKRPIYWLFASPKGTFSALIYLHRYRPDTVSVVLQYLRDFRKKLAARLEHLQQVQIGTAASQGDKTKAGKEADTIRKQQRELDDYERDTLYPLATEQVTLDLDDGVKVNYLKLGNALKTIPGLAAKGED
ncbi:MAG TPA: BREX-1 system adenine-specific DNA-methyltransferase PglX [Devosia sp.]|nr:BREX-1 system adenine-specific DNA-methyltransferase PglX [Devosia sp.]